jgi:hypothetical protein
MFAAVEPMVFTCPFFVFAVSVPFLFLTNVHCLPGSDLTPSALG